MLPVRSWGRTLDDIVVGSGVDSIQVRCGRRNDCVHVSSMLAHLDAPKSSASPVRGSESATGTVPIRQPRGTWQPSHRAAAVSVFPALRGQLPPSAVQSDCLRTTASSLDGSICEPTARSSSPENAARVAPDFTVQFVSDSVREKQRGTMAVPPTVSPHPSHRVSDFGDGPRDRKPAKSV
jgi:hypothetical protein